MVRDENERPRYGVLLGTVIAAVAVQGAVVPGATQQIVVSALLGLSLVLAFRIAYVSPAIMATAYALALAALAVAATLQGWADFRAFPRLGPAVGAEALLLAAALVACVLLPFADRRGVGR